jgi:hypothetical protein
MTTGNRTTSRGKQETLAHKNKSGTWGKAAAVEATATQCWRRLRRTMSCGGSISGGVGIGDEVNGTVAMMG